MLLLILLSDRICLFLLTAELVDGALHALVEAVFVIVRVEADGGGSPILLVLLALGELF